jgi:hypothetical protein
LKPSIAIRAAEKPTIHLAITNETYELSKDNTQASSILKLVLGLIKVSEQFKA